MKVKLCDLVEVATDDISAWFDACEPPGDCRAPARDLKDMAYSFADWFWAGPARFALSGKSKCRIAARTNLTPELLSRC